MSLTLRDAWDAIESIGQQLISVDSGIAVLNAVENYFNAFFRKPEMLNASHLVLLNEAAVSLLVDAKRNMQAIVDTFDEQYGKETNRKPLDASLIT